MKAADLRTKTIPELKDILNTLGRRQFTLRLVKATGELIKTHEIKETRRNIARVETILTEKEGEAT